MKSLSVSRGQPMRILISGHIYPDSFARNTAVAAERMGNRVATVDPLRLRKRLGYVGTILGEYFLKALASVECRWHAPLIRTAKAFQPELILITHCTLPPKVVDQLRQVSNAKVVVWFADQ